MPAYVPKAERKPRTTRRRARTQQANDDSMRAAPSITAPGRLRAYLDADNGRNFDLDDTTTTEAHLIDPDHPSWYVPDGREPYLRDRNRKSGTLSGEINAGDVGRYKKSDFSTKSTNEHDHSKKLILHIPTQMFNELAAIVNSKAFPAREIESLARTYLYEGIELTHRIARQDGVFIPHSHRAQLEAAAIVNRSMQAVLEYDAVLNDGCDLIRRLLGAGARNKARAAVFELVEIAKKMNSSELRDLWQRKLKNDFGYLLKGKGAQVHVGKSGEQDGNEAEE